MLSESKIFYARMNKGNCMTKIKDTIMIFLDFFQSFFIVNKFCIPIKVQKQLKASDDLKNMAAEILLC